MGWLGGVVMVAALGAAPLAREASALPTAPAAAQQQQATQQPADAERSAAFALQEEVAAAMSYPSSVCKKKRVDACGCHHVYGVRHCHPDRKGKHCEAVVKAELPWTQAEPQPLAL